MLFLSGVAFLVSVSLVFAVETRSQQFKLFFALRLSVGTDDVFRCCDVYFHFSNN